MISVIVCTYNRAQSLQKTLESLEDMIIPPSVSWEPMFKGIGRRPKIFDWERQGYSQRQCSAMMPPVVRRFRQRQEVHYGADSAEGASRGPFALGPGRVTALRGGHRYRPPDPLQPGPCPLVWAWGGSAGPGDSGRTPCAL